MNLTSYFRGGQGDVHAIPPDKAEFLQLEAARAVFVELSNQLPSLLSLTTSQGITELTNLDAAASLLFPHGFYKSYPEQLLIEGAHAPLTEWLSRLTTHDLSAVKGRQFETLDDWLDALDRETPLEMYHSSGTSGRLSFYPRGKAEVEAQKDHTRITIQDWYPGGWTFAMFWPAHAFGRSAVLRVSRLIAELVCEGDHDFHPLLPAPLSADYHYHVLRSRNMAEQGFAFGPVASPYVKARIEEAEALQRFVPERIEQLLDIMESHRGSKRLLLAGGPANIHALASAGLARGMRDVAMEGSVVRSFGGFKNAPVITDAEAQILKFLGGGARYLEAFGMTELTCAFSQCEHRRYHVPPWVVPYVFDVETGALLPRAGVQRGRSGFLDLLPQSYWGGIITGDHVEMSWDPCACGRTTPHMSTQISRLPPGREDDCFLGPATDLALRAALTALREGLPQAN